MTTAVSVLIQVLPRHSSRDLRAATLTRQNRTGDSTSTTPEFCAPLCPVRWLMAAFVLATRSVVRISLHLQIKSLQRDSMSSCRVDRRRFCGAGAYNLIMLSIHLIF